VRPETNYICKKLKIVRLMTEEIEVDLLVLDGIEYLGKSGTDSIIHSLVSVFFEIMGGPKSFEH
jgi:hypothetical protein